MKINHLNAIFMVVVVVVVAAETIISIRIN
jgi:hypothetical protein